MIFKKIIILFLLLINLNVLYAVGTNLLAADNEYFFYIPLQEEIDDFFKFYNFLEKIDNKQHFISINDIKELYVRFINKKTLHSLLFEAFLIQTQNEDLREDIITVITDNMYSDTFSEALRRKYQSTPIIRERNGKEITQFNYNDEFYDENINLFYMSQVKIFNKRFGLMLHKNEWENMKFKNKEGETDKDNFVLMFGGGTNSMSVSFNQDTNISFTDFYQNEILKEIHFSKFDTWEILELQPEGILERAGADSIYIGYGTGPDVIPEIDTAAFIIYLYNEKYKIGYSVKYFMNFSKINNYFESRKRIWNLLLLYLNFTFIELTSFE